MDWPVFADINGANEGNAGVNFKNIRIFKVNIKDSSVEQRDLVDNGIAISWSEPSPSVLPLFSAVCWYFGKELYQRLNVPIGLVQSAVGGTEIERWITSQDLDSCGAPKRPTTDSVFFNGMIKPIMSMSMFGAIWYQGESNAGYNRNFYKCLFSTMIREWRSKWFINTDASTNPNFPFGFVQIANYGSEKDTNIYNVISDYPWLRWHQTADMGYVPNSLLPNVFMANAIDLVEGPDVQDQIHPRFKELVGKRLAAGAQNLGYYLPVKWNAPRVSQVTYSNQKIRIEYVDVATSQKLGPGEILSNDETGFEVCCDYEQCFQDQYSKRWQPLSGLDAYSLAYDSSAVFNKPQNCSVPKYVRYLWRQKPCTFFNCPLYLNDPRIPLTSFISQVLVF
jgi:sialate O-acetylesterase